MLCTKIVFTGDNKDYKQKISDYMVCHNIKHHVYCTEDSSEVETEADDEGLYGICCELTGYIKDVNVKTAVKRFLHNNYYACFNSDEIGLICNRISDREFLDELSGRLYVYTKVKNSVNPFAFYDFMCKDMDSKVKEVSAEEADRLIAANENSEFIDLLKNFTFVSMESFDKVELVADSSGIRISSCTPEEKQVCTEYALDEEDILAELVTMNPKKIEIDGKEEFLKNEISSVITAVFQDRIQYK